MSAQRPVKIAIVVGEESGDLLGARLMEALQGRLGERVSFCGLGGARMQRLGLCTLFDISDISVMGLSAVMARLSIIVRRVYQTVDAIIAENPDVLVIIDSPDFTHNVAKRVRKRAPHIPVVGYVSPSVWAWRSGRASKMKVYVDELLALLPFEPDVHRKLGGPTTHYVGHPLIERFAELRPADGERTPISNDKKVLLVLPGSRGSEVDRLLTDFGETIGLVSKRFPDLEILLPAVPHLEEKIRSGVSDWPVKPHILIGEEAKYAAFRRAHAALAASGTVSLELGISGIPMVVAYRVDWFFRRLKQLNRIFKFAGVTSMVLPNIILQRNVVPEFLDEDVRPAALRDVLLLLLQDTPQRQDQIDGLRALDHEMQLEHGGSQSEAAADVVVQVLNRHG
ncbi:lipid-A-disaccharide synthase [Roseibium algae]|uniref:Lipid-A-disaccharide synthase n=1 Tax=Roseibium algae TaxID=3123038 RepID=A0ABU8TJE5_9HYPH